MSDDFMDTLEELEAEASNSSQASPSEPESDFEGEQDTWDLSDEGPLPPRSLVDDDKEPNPRQLEAITAPIDSAVRVLAPPGAGKTFVLARRFVHLLENGADPTTVLAVTFNKTMADELYRRISARVAAEGLPMVTDRSITTIHAACYRMLRDDGDMRRMPKVWQMKKWLQEDAERRWEEPGMRPAWSEILSWIGAAKHLGLDHKNDTPLYKGALGEYHGERLDEARWEFDSWMRNNSFLTFDDMLFDIELKLALRGPFYDKWTSKYKYLIVDEGQDTSGQAMRILTTLAQPEDRFFIVGDTDQLLYRFAGATPEANLYDGFERLYPDGLLIKLEVNYRSTLSIIQACSKLIAHNYGELGGPYDAKYWKEVQPRPDAPEGEPVTFKMFDKPEHEASSLVRQLGNMLQTGARIPGDFFVGFRTRAQAAYLEGPLLRAKIPYINISGGSFWTLRHVADVVAYLKLAHDQTDRDAFARVYNIASVWMTVPWRSADTFGQYCSHRYLGRQFLQYCDSKLERVWFAVEHRNSFRPGAEDLVSFVNEIKAVLQATGPADAVRFIVENCYRKWMQVEMGLAEHDASEDGKLVDLDMVVEVAAEFGDATKFLEYVDELVAADRAAQDKEWGEYVILSTVHRLKGLERPVVFGIGLSEGEFPNGQPAGLLPHTFSMVDPPNLGILPSGGKGRVEDERCVAFVLASRAKDEVHLSGVRQYGKAQLGPSRFIWEMIEVEGVEGD